MGTDNTWVAVACGSDDTATPSPSRATAASGPGATTPTANSASVTPRSARARPGWAQTTIGQRSTCGGYHTVALKSDGSLWTWGYNSLGQLGLGDTTSRTSPTAVPTGGAVTWSAHAARIAAGYRHSGAVSRPTGASGPGVSNQYGQLGLGDGAAAHQPDPGGRRQRLGLCRLRRLPHRGPRGATAASGPGAATPTASSAGRLDQTARARPRSGTDSNWVTVAGGAYHTVALKSDGSLWAWGDNEVGPARHERHDNRTSPEQVGRRHRMGVCRLRRLLHRGPQGRRQSLGLGRQ